MSHRRLQLGPAAFVACAVCAALASGCGSPGPRPVLVADSVAQFSDTQGANGWTYGYWDRTADRDGRYDPTTDFQLLPHYGDDPINGIRSHPSFTTGSLWFLQNGRYFTSLWAHGGHPHGVLDLGDHARAEQWAVRRWISSIDGPVEIRGHVGKVMPWGSMWTGGCMAQIAIDGDTVLREDMDDRGADYAVDAKLRIGTRVDFLIGPNPSIGVTEFTASVWAASPGR